MKINRSCTEVAFSHCRRFKGKKKDDYVSYKDICVSEQH